MGGAESCLCFARRTSTIAGASSSLWVSQDSVNALACHLR